MPQCVFIPDAYEENELNLTWIDSSPVELDEPSLPQFILIGTSNKNCNLKYKTGILSDRYSALIPDYNLIPVLASGSFQELWNGTLVVSHTCYACAFSAWLFYMFALIYAIFKCSQHILLSRHSRIF